VARGLGHADRHHRGVAIEVALPDFLAQRLEELDLVFVRAGFVLRRAGFAPGVSEPHEAQRIKAKALDDFHQFSVFSGLQVWHGARLNCILNSCRLAELSKRSCPEIPFHFRD